MLHLKLYQFTFYIFLLLMCDRSYGVINKLNETEYEKLPKLSELENYESCLEHPEAVYCVASMQLYGDSNNKIYNIIQEYSKLTLKHFNYSTIERGICVTKTCEKFIQKSNSDIKVDRKDILEGCLNEIINEKYGLNTRIFRLNCDEATENQMDIDLFDYTVAILFVILLIFIISGSYYDLRFNRETNGNRNKEKQRNDVLLCFSVFQNIDRLTSEPNIDERLLELKGLYGVRTIGQILVVFAHSLFMLTGFVSDPHNFEKAYESKFRIIFSATSLVQLYFFITGFLMTYYLQIYSEKNKMSWRDIPLIILSRWCKLTASLAFVIAFIATWLRHIGSGPLWKYFVTNGATAQCRDYYWAHLFYINNFIQEDKFCLLQTWHLAVDIQLFIMGLIVYYMILNRGWKTKCATLLVLSAIGVMSPIFYILKRNLDGVAVYSPEALRTLNDRNFHEYHVLAQNNLPSFIIGMGSAYLGYYLRQRQIDFRNSKVGNIMCWLSIPLLIGVFHVTGLTLENAQKPVPLFTLIFAASHKFLIGILISVWTLGVILKFNGVSKAVCEWRGFQIMNKLSYGVFLINIDVYNVLMASRTRLMPVSFLHLFFIFIGVAVICYVLAFFLYLLVEAPVIQLFHKYFERGPIKKKIE